MAKGHIGVERQGNYGKENETINLSRGRERGDQN